MSKESIAFEDFLANVHPENIDFVNQIHGVLIQNGSKYKIEMAKNGHVVSYSSGHDKRAIVNFVFRKGGLIFRIYADGINQYPQILINLPDNMIRAIEKATVCKQLIDPPSCSPKCRKGYAFDLKGVSLKKCRYSCFMIEVKVENYEAIRSFLELELDYRNV